MILYRLIVGVWLSSPLCNTITRLTSFATDSEVALSSPCHHKKGRHLDSLSPSSKRKIPGLLVDPTDWSTANNYLKARQVGKKTQTTMNQDFIVIIMFTIQLVYTSTQSPPNQPANLPTSITSRSPPIYSSSSSIPTRSYLIPPPRPPLLTLKIDGRSYIL